MFQKVSAEHHWFRDDFPWTALNFLVPNGDDSGKIRADQLWNRADQRWYFVPSLNQHWNTSNLWISAVSALIFPERVDNHWSLLKQLLSFLIFPWDNAEHPWSLSSISCPHRTFAIFLQGNLDITLSWIIISYCFSANTRSFIFRETSAGKLKSYGFWELQSHYFSAKSRSYSLFADFLQETPDLEISGNLDFSFANFCGKA